MNDYHANKIELNLERTNRPQMEFGSCLASEFNVKLQFLLIRQLIHDTHDLHKSCDPMSGKRVLISDIFNLKVQGYYRSERSKTIPIP